MSSKFSDVDEYGFRRSSDFDYNQYEKFVSAYYAVLSKQSKKWFHFMQNKKNMRRSKILKKYIRRGIPSSYRTQVWMTVSGADELVVNNGANYYPKLLSVTVDADVVHSIKMDLPRTFPNNIYFYTADGCQQQLYRILYAHAADNAAIGYCQGLNYIAGLLLLATKNEATTFWLLKSLVQKILPEYYTRNMKGLILDIKVFSEIIRMTFPDLHKHASSMNVCWSLLVSKWFICLYAEVLPTETVLRIWDCLFYDKCKVLFKVGLTIIKHLRKQLLACANFVEFAECFRGIQNDVFVLDCHEFVKRTYKDTRFLTNRKIERLRKQFAKVNPEEKKSE